MRVVPVTANVSFDSHLVVSRVVVTAIMSLATPGRMTVAPRTIAFIDITGSLTLWPGLARMTYTP
jgi:hypothetical protein